MIAWTASEVAALSYAVQVERALAADHAELVLSAHAKDEARKDMARNREELDAWLLSPMGDLAVAEKRLVQELGGAA